MQEQELEGGQVSQVSRRGDTVLRTSTVATPTVQKFLGHLRANGISWVPEPQGLAADGREQLGWIEGEVPHEMPSWIWDTAVLRQVVLALRQFHDASASFACEDAMWGLPAAEPCEVVCHNDFAPYNWVFRGRTFVGAIDFDACAPGPRLRDLAYIAYRMAPLMAPLGSGRDEGCHLSDQEVDQRLTLLLDVYAEGQNEFRYQPVQLWLAASKRMVELAEWTEALAAEKASAELCGDAAMYRADAKFQIERASRL